MKYQLAILALLLIPANVRAQETISAAEKEAMYQVMCVANSDTLKNMKEEDKADALNSQKNFINFLKNPESAVEALKSSPLFTDEELENPLDILGPVIAFTMTCGMTEVLKSDIESRGCSDGKDSVSVKKAAELCQPLIEKMKQ